MKEGQAFGKEWNEEHSQYDICNYEELIKFTPDSTFNSGMIEGIKKSFKVYTDCAETPECAGLLEKSADELFHILVSNFDSIFLTAEHWEYIYDELRRDKLTFKRFYPMTRVSHNGNLEYLLRAFVTDDEFWSYCCEHYTENAEN